MRHNKKFNDDRSGYRLNHQIRVPQIRVIDAEGEQLGLMTPSEARVIAEEKGLDLVEVAPQAKPPVCRIMDYGKFRYQQSKRASASKSARVQLKEIRLRPKTDDHDIETKIRKAEDLLEKGNNIRFVMRLRGRENAHKNRWLVLMQDLVTRFEDKAKITSRPKADGRTITATLEPVSSSSS